MPFYRRRFKRSFKRRSYRRSYKLRSRSRLGGLFSRRYMQRNTYRAYSQEVKHIDRTFNEAINVPSADGGVWSFLSLNNTIIPGYEASQRIGNSVFSRSIFFRGSITATTSNTQIQVVRVMLIVNKRVKFPGVDGDLFNLNYLFYDTSNIYSGLNTEHVKNFVILYDQFHKIDIVHPLSFVRCFKKLGFKTKYLDKYGETTINQILEGEVLMVAGCSLPSTGETVLGPMADFEVRVRYTDS